jgi:mannose-6-phosphate isomerase-like protein (cupin superfamily)
VSVQGAVDLGEISASARGSGAVWTLREGRDLNANLVRFPTGEGVGEHVNGEVDVLFVGVSGSGVVELDGREHALGAGILVLAPRGARRTTRSASSDFSYLTVHKRRGPVGVGRKGPNA